MNLQLNTLKFLDILSQKYKGIILSKKISLKLAYGLHIVKSRIVRSSFDAGI